MHVLALLGLAVLVALAAHPASYSWADDSIELIDSDYTFVDSQGMANVVGIVNNRGDMPVTVTMALDTTAGTLQEGLYGSIIFPGEGAPFKFKLEPGVEATGRPYIAKAEQVDAPLYETLVLDYDNMAVGEERILKGTVRNEGSMEFHNVYVYASVHGEDMADIDSVKSNVIPVLRPGEEAEFIASPDPAVKSDVYYYSCAGLDPNAPISTISTGDGGFIPYTMQTVSKISSLKYDNATDSITFGITPYNPDGGKAELWIPQLSKNQTVTVLLDGEPTDAQVRMDGKTVYVDMFVPSGQHQVQVQGVRTIPEFPLALLALAAIVSVAIFASRFKAAFKAP